jgi:hypothetical protein
VNTSDILFLVEENMEKLDLKKELKYLYSPSAKKVEQLAVPRFQFLMINGAIEPGKDPGTSPLFQENMQALYGAAFTLKFMLKLRQENPVDYPVMALEGLWWVEDGQFDITIKDNWFYTLMILMPDLVMPEMVTDAVDQLRKKKGDLPGFSCLCLVSFEEGLSIQILHIGPYDAEPASVEKMDAYALENGLVKTGKHHEIYLGNPLRADPAKLKTILRHPVEKITP